MTLRTKVVLLALAPLLLISIAFALAMVNLADELAQRELETFENNLLRSKETALKSYVSIMRITSGYLIEKAESDEEAKRSIQELMQRMHFSEDGYFFAYTPSGVNLVHATQPGLVGMDLLNIKDNNSNYVIRNLLARATEGGGFHNYLWQKPTSRVTVDKISYVESLPPWNWMFGTGLYLDDIQQEMELIKDGVDENVADALLTFVIIALLAVMGVLIASIWFNVHEHRLADQSLKELSHKTVQLQEEERRRVSRELHDGINQLLVSVKYRIETVLGLLQESQQTLREPLLKGRETLKQAIQEARRISHDLRPSILDDLGLVAALEHLGEDFEERSGIDVSVYLQVSETKLDEDIATTLYRIAQEALYNVEKHAGARQVTLRLEQDAEGLFLEVKDDGAGFSLRRLGHGRGIGIRNMRERVEFLGGNFSVHSEEGKGTCIQVTFMG
ncbi:MULTISPECIES: cache domain-containing protein [unclassified Hahella]|uniref:cache domain-containing protein n=1 Tax=unclassified Hahella TaxID=2624107 RepID=UPI001C1F0770|nr:MULTISPECIES: cache domain-containing protein [unclassified Hahella]MBU6954235.1 cache domain-containing protein [Hahella sp. HN01]MDG9666141.1 cache domain-containing protein [Hahella sp. CR1]